MLQDLAQLLQEHYMDLCRSGAVIAVCGVAVQFWLFRRNGPKFPPRSSVAIRFEEKMASGRSHKSIITRLGGARNCLNVVVTGEELWITAMFPFNLNGYFYDGLHRIPLPLVLRASKSGRNVLVEFQRPGGTLGVYELRLKDPERFLAVLGKGA